MKLIKFTLFTCLLAVLLLGLPSPVFAQAPITDSPIVFGGTYVLPSNRTIDDLVIFGGSATLEATSTVTGDIVIFGGTLDASGEVRGDITSFGGSVRLNDNAVVKGDLNTLGGQPNISDKATVVGNRVFTVGSVPLNLSGRVLTSGLWETNPFGGFLWVIFLALIIAALAAVVGLLLPTPLERVSGTIALQPVAAGGVGLLTIIVAPALLLVLSVTIILIPLALLGIFALALAVILGWIALGFSLGKRLATLTNSDWPVPVSAGVGTLLLGLIINLLLWTTGHWWLVLVCLGVPVALVINMVTLGGVVLSRAGTAVYNPAAGSRFYPTASQMPMQPASSMPPTAPMPPVAPAQPFTPVQPAPWSYSNPQEPPQDSDKPTL